MPFIKQRQVELLGHYDSFAANNDSSQNYYYEMHFFDALIALGKLLAGEKQQVAAKALEAFMLRMEEFERYGRSFH